MKDLEFGYNPEVPVLKGINYVLDKPEFVCIMGPNGVGKSTLIHCMNKILKPSGGFVYINDKEVREYKLKELASHMVKAKDNRKIRKRIYPSRIRHKT